MAQETNWPETAGEWQRLVDLAEWCLNLDSARKYGLIDGGPHVHADRAEEILAEGRRRGHIPSADCVERLTAEYLAEQDQGRMR